MERILFVDDDENILNGLKRLLRNKYDITTFTNGNEAIEYIKTSKPFSVVVSDFRMPEMDGIKFLSACRITSPDMVRIMLTGYADINIAMDAINEGNIFRFLVKPTNNELLLKVLKDAVDYYKLIISERELLQQTLYGAIKVLVEILELVNPTAFSKAVRLRNLAKKLAKNQPESLVVKIELAALLSQIGVLALPPDVLQKVEQEKTLSLAEHKLYLDHPNFSRALLSKIPRLEEVAEAIALQFKEGSSVEFDEINGQETEVQIIAKIIRKATKIDSFMEGKRKEEEQEMALEEKNAQDKKKYDNFLRIHELQVGMEFDQDVVDKGGVVLIGKGQRVTQVIKLRLKSYLDLGRIYNLVKVKV